MLLRVVSIFSRSKYDVCMCVCVQLVHVSNGREKVWEVKFSEVGKVWSCPQVFAYYEAERDRVRLDKQIVVRES